MKCRTKNFLCVILALCFAVFSLCYAYAEVETERIKEEPIILEYNNTKSAVTSVDINSNGKLTIINTYKGYPSITTHAKITTYVEKKVIGFFWKRMDNGQTNNEWVDNIYAVSYSGAHTLQLSSKGTYRITVTYEIFGEAGSADIIPCIQTTTY